MSKKEGAASAGSVETYSIDQMPTEISLNAEKIGKGLVKNQVVKVMSFNTNFSEDEIRRMMVSIRWQNKICLGCTNHEAYARFYTCPKCQLVFYCSETCQKHDQGLHTIECGNSTLPLTSIRTPLFFAMVDIHTQKVVKF